MTQSIDKLERLFENFIKRKFREFRTAEEEDFELSLDFDCSLRLNNLLEAIGLSVCGMHYRPSEISIDFELDNELTYDISNYIFREITIYIENDGNYEVSIDDRILGQDWRASFLNFETSLSMKNKSPEIINKAISDIEKQLVFKSLKTQ